MMLMPSTFLHWINRTLIVCACLPLSLIGAEAAHAHQVWQRLDVVHQLVGETAPREEGLRLELPLVSEDGAAVPLTVAFEGALEPDDSIESIHIFATGNPNPEIAAFRFGPRAGKAEVSTRIRLNASQTVIAVARSRRGKVIVGSRDVRVTVSGCLVRTAERGDDALSTPRVAVARKVQAGVPTEIRTLINHPMETGLRQSVTGETLPRRIISTVSANLDGETVLEATFYPAISANPYLRFHLTPAESGELSVVWMEDTGAKATHSASVKVLR